MKTYTITLSFEVPNTIPKKDVKEWAQYQTHYRNNMSDENPLAGKDLEPYYFLLH